MKIAREGYPLIVTAAVVTTLTFVLGWVAIGVILGVCTLAIVGFFRDPERTIPTGEGLIVSPADGKVVSIVDTEGQEFARGISDYSRGDAESMIGNGSTGQASSRAAGRAGVLVKRDNIVLLDRK